MFQEWYCDLLAGEIARIPDKERTALLTDLVNHLHFTHLEKGGVAIAVYRGHSLAMLKNVESKKAFYV
jgi:hypothetical protein